MLDHFLFPTGAFIVDFYSIKDLSLFERTESQVSHALMAIVAERVMLLTSTIFVDFVCVILQKNTLVALVWM